MPKTATDQVDTLASIGDQIRVTAIAETRKQLSVAIDDQSFSPEADIVATLDKDMPESVRMLRGRFAVEGVSADFLAGIRYAAALAGDKRFEL